MGTLIYSNNAYLKTFNTLREVLIYLYIKKIQSHLKMYIIYLTQYALMPKLFT
jgi:hypothetical protein